MTVNITHRHVVVHRQKIVHHHHHTVHVIEVVIMSTNGQEAIESLHAIVAINTIETHESKSLDELLWYGLLTYIRSFIADGITETIADAIIEVAVATMIYRVIIGRRVVRHRRTFLHLRKRCKRQTINYRPLTLLKSIWKTRKELKIIL
jgi:hypothetical protein